ncbi:MAG: hypothetical protein JST85_06320 [Acidobacteria bacterium]|nr:hypothetical protein [Acidobacteriota bacterium]
MSQKICFLGMLVDLILIVNSISGQTHKDVIEKQQAQAIWEQVIAAKGGRENLYRVNCFARLDTTGGDRSSDLYVFPDKFFRYTGTSHPEFGTMSQMFNFESNTGYTVWGAFDPPRVNKKFPIDGQLRSYFRSVFVYLLETKWLKVEPLRPIKGKIGQQEVDGVEVFLPGFYPADSGTIYKVYLDAKTRLPLRFVDRMVAYDAESSVDYRNYKEMKGVMMQTEVNSGHGWNPCPVEVNPDYDPQVFERIPDIKAGPYQWRKKKL